jgi:hypothetical protein
MCAVLLPPGVNPIAVKIIIIIITLFLAITYSSSGQKPGMMPKNQCVCAQ